MTQESTSNNRALAIVDDSIKELNTIELNIRHVVTLLSFVKDGPTRASEIRRIEEIAQDLRMASKALRAMTVSRGHVLRVKDQE